ncbi:hypothetical protein KUV89_00550 [Marinobacter hydrocarbonoclasticus]|nr:hypothetical protein [Marinobacter nauticus]
MSAPQLAATARADNLFLTGPLSACRSDALNHCQRAGLDPLQLRSAYRGPVLSLSDKTLDQLDIATSGLDTDTRPWLVGALTSIAQAHGDTDIRADEWWDEITARPEVGARLSPAQWLLIQDQLEQPQTDRFGTRLTTQGWPEAGRTPHAAALLRTLTDSLSSGTAKTPLMVVLTSGNRDPFAASDGALALFDETDLTLAWLPLDASLQSARRAHQCSELERHRQRVQGNAERARIYPRKVADQQRLCLQPERGLTLLEQADAVYLADGDEARYLATLLTPDGNDTKEMAVLRRRLADNTLTLVATGRAASALVAALGAKDEGFARIRLHTDTPAEELLLTPAPITMTLDSDTAWSLTEGSGAVAGRGGLWLYQRPTRLSHYLRQGDTLNWSDAGPHVALNDAGTPQNDGQDAPLIRNLNDSSVLAITDELCRSTQRQALGRFGHEGKAMGAVWTLDQESRFGSGKDGHCRYINVRLDVGEAGTAQER